MAKISDSLMMRKSSPSIWISVPEYFPYEYGVADFYSYRLIFFTGAGSHNGTTLGFLFCRIGNDDPTLSLFFGGSRFHNYPIL